MPRRSSGGRSSSTSSRPSASSKPLRDPPKRVTPSPPPAPAQGSNGPAMGGGLGASIADGLAFGTGSAVAHRAADALLGPRVIHHETVGSSAPAAASAPDVKNVRDACGEQSKAFIDCLNSNGNDIGKCQFYMDMLQECTRNTGAALIA